MLAEHSLRQERIKRLKVACLVILGGRVPNTVPYDRLRSSRSRDEAWVSKTDHVAGGRRPECPLSTQSGHSICDHLAVRDDANSHDGVEHRRCRQSAPSPVHPRRRLGPRPFRTGAPPACAANPPRPSREMSVVEMIHAAALVQETNAARAMECGHHPTRAGNWLDMDQVGRAAFLMQIKGPSINALPLSMPSRSRPMCLGTLPASPRSSRSSDPVVGSFARVARSLPTRTLGRNSSPAHGVHGRRSK